MIERQNRVIGGILVLMIAATAIATRGDHAPDRPDHLRASYSPLHFKPAIDKATDADCLACHREVLEDRVRERTPGGMASEKFRASYQQVSTYTGPQETFHRRHLVTPLARRLMDLRCTTCHQGQDMRDEAQGSSATAPGQADLSFALRKQVDPATTCLMCHGRMPWEHMGLAGPWEQVKAMFRNSCLDGCHEMIRTVRHRVSYLKADAIEAAGREDAESCHGCHGGRAWYRISYPYPRHEWPEMSGTVPDWARDRPTESEARFRLGPVARSFKP